MDYRICFLILVLILIFFFLLKKERKKQTTSRNVFVQSNQGGLGYIPTEEDIAKMSPEHQKLYFETKEKVLSTNAEAGVPTVPLDQFLKGFTKSEQFSFEYMCQLWQFSAGVNFLSNPPRNFEFSG